MTTTSYQLLSENIGTIWDNPSMIWRGPVEYNSVVVSNADTTNSKHSLAENFGWTTIVANIGKTVFSLTNTNGTAYSIVAHAIAYCTAGPDINTSYEITTKYKYLVTSGGASSFVVGSISFTGGVDPTILSWLFLTTGTGVNIQLLPNATDSWNVTWKIDVLKTTL